MQTLGMTGASDFFCLLKCSRASSSTWFCNIPGANEERTPNKSVSPYGHTTFRLTISFFPPTDLRLIGIDLVQAGLVGAGNAADLAAISFQPLAHGVIIVVFHFSDDKFGRRRSINLFARRKIDV